MSFLVSNFLLKYYFKKLNGYFNFVTENTNIYHIILYIWSKRVNS